MSSTLRKRGLQPDDPTAAAPVPREDVSQPVPQHVPQAASATPPEWRDWSPATGATSYRLPPELLAELAARSYAAGVPQGQIVLAAITTLLDQSDEQVIELCDRAARALRTGRRKQATTRKPKRKAAR